MGRSPRDHVSLAVYHVMARGNGGQDILSEVGDWEHLLEIISHVKQTSDFKLYAYCLMTNHFHALVRVYNDPLSHFMQRIGTTWAKRFNKERERHGHVFQDRFKSKSCGQDTEYCRWLLRYIHINPVKAGLVNRPEDWEWSSYRQYLGISDGFADIEWPMELFEGRRASFADFVLQGINDRSEPREMEDSRAKLKSCPLLDSFPPPKAPGFEELTQRIAQETNVAAEKILGSGRIREVCSARRKLAENAATFGYRTTFIAKKLGVSPSAVSRMLRLKPDSKQVK